MAYNGTDEGTSNKHIGLAVTNDILSEWTRVGNQPILKNPDGHFELIQDTHGFVVGWEKSMKYNEYTLKLKKGSKLFLYTDGVPEATGPTGKFGRDATLEALRKYEDLTPKEILDNMKVELNMFTGNRDQFDDVTMLCLEYKGYDNE